LKKIPVFVLSKLAFADVLEWNSIQRQLDSEKRGRFWFYHPLRRAIVRRIVEGEPARQDILQELVRSAGKCGAACVEYSLRAFDTFESVFLRKIGSFSADLMKRNGSSSSPTIGGLVLEGGPHIEIMDRRGKRRFVYLHPSRDWSVEEKLAFCELLLLIVKHKYGAEAPELWFFDLSEGELIVCRQSRSTIRKRCERTAQMLRVLMEDPENLSAA